MTDFAGLQRGVNDAVFASLANVRVSIDLVEMDGMFDPRYALGQVGALGMATTAPVLWVPTDALVSDPIGCEVVIGDAGYRVAQHEPDGSGASMLYLELA